MDLVDVINRLAVDPNHRYHVEESPPLGEGLRRNEDRRPDRIHQLLHDAIIDLKNAGVMLLEVDIDGLEELKRVIDYLAAAVGEIGDADVDDVQYEGLEARLGQLEDV